MTQYSSNITVMLKAARCASRKLIRDFGEVENLQVSRKGPKDFVTAADLRAEKEIVNSLQYARPEYPILAEESGLIAGSDKRFRWLVDPLDGTTNFMHGMPMFSITIALEEILPNGKSEIVAAVTDSPIYKETFWAEKGNGAWLESGDRNGSQRLRVSNRKKLIDSLLCVGSISKDLSDNNLVAEFSAVRCIGSTALGLAYTAAGRFDCFLQKSAQAWDYGAGILLVKEAGGTVTDINGKDKMLQDKSIIATNEELHAHVSKCLRA